MVVFLPYKEYAYPDLNVTLFGKRAFADVIQDLRMRSSHLGLFDWVLNPKIRILIREKTEGDLRPR